MIRKGGLQLMIIPNTITDYLYNIILVIKIEGQNVFS